MKRGLLLVGALWVLLVAVSVQGSGPGPADGTAVPTFTKDVAPILYNNCVVCHRPGQVAPMSLISYQDVRPWAKSIKSRVQNREMPPWGADPHYGKFKGDRNLTENDIEIIARWVDSGAQKGDDANLPPMPEFASTWVLGQPDAVIEMPIDFEIPAEGEVDVTDFYVKAPFTEDVFIKGVEVRPGFQAAVHHAGVFVVDRMPEGTKIVNGRAIGPDGKMLSKKDISRANGRTAFEENQKLLSFVPGRGFESYQAGAGQRIKAGSYIDFYMHYQATGKPEKDRTAIALYFAKPGQEVTHQIYHSFGSAGPTSYVVQGKELTNEVANGDDSSSDRQALPPIPPYVDDWKVVSIHSIAEPITLYGLTPHLHLRGKSMKYVLTTPDGKEEVLLSVPRYDFNWQLYYELETPKKIPAGSKVTVTTMFDNSLKNKYNPGPDKEVYWSEQSWDEMYAPQARITIDNRDLRKANILMTERPHQER